MSKKKNQFRKRKDGSYPNAYWDEVKGPMPPAIVLWPLKLPDLSDKQFMKMVKRIGESGIYWEHNRKQKLLTMAFSTAEQKLEHVNKFAMEATLDGKDIKLEE